MTWHKKRFKQLHLRSRSPNLGKGLILNLPSPNRELFEKIKPDIAPFATDMKDSIYNENILIDPDGKMYSGRTNEYEVWQHIHLINGGDPPHIFDEYELASRTIYNDPRMQGHMVEDFYDAGFLRVVVTDNEINIMFFKKPTQDQLETIQDLQAWSGIDKMVIEVANYPSGVDPDKNFVDYDGFAFYTSIQDLITGRVSEFHPITPWTGKQPSP